MCVNLTVLLSQTTIFCFFSMNVFLPQVTVQQRLREESRNWALISIIATAIVWSFTSGELNF